MLDHNKIVLNTNIVNDHHAMGIIDNFAKRLKFTFSKLFIRKKYKKWVYKLQLVLNTYNNSQHSSIGKLTPNQAQDDEHKQLLVNLNTEKAQYNKTVSDLKPGDKVRKLETHLFKKGTEPKFSEEMFEVKQANGGTVTLTDETRHKRQNLLKIPNDS